MDFNNFRQKLVDFGSLLIPIFYGIIVNVSYGQLMMIGSTIVYFVTLLITKIAIAKAKVRKEYIEAENLSLEPTVKANSRKIAELEKQLEQANQRIDYKNQSIYELSHTNRELSFAVLERKGTIKRKET